MMIDTAPQKKHSVNNPQPSTVRTHGSRRAILRSMGERNNDGSFKNSRAHQALPVWNDQAIFTPRRRKLKGYQKNARK